MDFSPILDGFCRPLRKSCGGFGEHFGDQKMSQKSNMIFFNRNVIFKSFWEGVGKVLGRFEKGFGKVLERSGSLLGALRTSRNCFNSFFLFLMSLVAFSLFFCCFCLIIAYFACFLRLLLFVFAKLCWDEFQIFWLEIACFYYSSMYLLFPFLAQTGDEKSWYSEGNCFAG